MSLERLNSALDAVLLANRFAKLLSCFEGFGLNEKLESRREVLDGELLVRDSVEELEVSMRERNRANRGGEGNGRQLTVRGQLQL